MVDKATAPPLSESGQAGDGTLRAQIPMPGVWGLRPESLIRPKSLTLEMMDRADDLIWDWHNSHEPTTWPLIVLLYELMVPEEKS